MEKKIIIKKYENRRLYDVTHSRYVNLDEIARTVQDGVDIQVLDASSGEDITRLVMTQIVTECAKAPDSVFPLDILRQMVVASGKASQESAMNYMRAVTDMYKNALRGFTKTMTPFELMQSLMVPGTQAEQLSPEQMAAVAAGTQSLAAQQQESAEIQELKQRIQELEAMVTKQGNAPEPAKATKKGAPKRGGS